jgi:rhodanese-related sulfurtransferase
MRKYLTVLLAASISVLVCAPAMAYDQALAKTYEQFFASFEEKAVPKALHLIPADKLMEAIKKGDDIVLLDVRTHQEQAIIGLTFANTLRMPMNEVFRPENLERIPTDKKVVVTCKSGVRCTVIALALRNVGFDNVYAMKGGLMELMKFLDPKTAF